MKKSLKFSVLIVAIMFMMFASTVALAAPTGQPGDNCSDLIRYNVGLQNRGNTNLQYVVCRIGVLINNIIPILIALGVLYFIWGVISYAIAKDDEAKSTGRTNMIMGLIALLVIVSIWGLVNILKSTFGLNNSSDVINVPCIQSPGVIC